MMANQVLQKQASKRQSQALTELDTFYQKHPQTITDVDTLYPPKKRALFDYNRELARKIHTEVSEKAELHFNRDTHQDTIVDEHLNGQLSLIDNTNRHAFYTTKLKLNRHDQVSEIRPRSDSLHSLDSQYSEISSLSSLNSASRESSPVAEAEFYDYEVPVGETVTLTSGSSADQNNASIELAGDPEISKPECITNIEIKEHETPERNPWLVLNGPKADVQKPLFTAEVFQLKETENTRPVISKSLFPLNQGVEKLGSNMKGNKHASTNSDNHKRGIFNSSSQVKRNTENDIVYGEGSEHNIQKENSLPFQYGNIPKSEKSFKKVHLKTHINYVSNSETQMVDSLIDDSEQLKNETKLLSNTNELNGSFKKAVGLNVNEIFLNTNDENSKNVTEKKNYDTSRILGDLTNSLNVKKKADERKINIQEIYKCSVCNKEFRQSGNFHSHMKLHVETNRICKCGICDIDFNDSKSLQDHMRSQHTGSHPYKCEKCNREFSQFNNLRRHMRVHREKTFKCNLCDRVFNEEFYLKMHVGTHTGQRVYTCGVCNASFQSSQELKSHVLTHSPSELHVCNVCGKAFSKACVLRQHKKAHSGERPHKCTLCSKTFIHRHHLTMHMRSHAESKPYYCDICNKVFSQTSHLYKHLRQHEEDNLENNPNAQTVKVIEKKQESNHVKHIAIAKKNNIMTYNQTVLENNPTAVPDRLSMNLNEIKNKDCFKLVNTTKENRVSDANCKVKGKFDAEYVCQANLKETLNLNMNPTSKEGFIGSVYSKKRDSSLTHGSHLITNSDVDTSRQKKKKVTNSKEQTGKVNEQMRKTSYTDLSAVTSQSLTGNPLVSSEIPLEPPPSRQSTSLKLPSFNSIANTCNLKVPNTMWSLSNSQVPLPYYSSPSLEQQYYTFSYGAYPNLSYDTSSMYMAYSAHLQAYYNMMYYNSRSALESQSRNSENGYTLENTSIASNIQSKSEYSKEHDSGGFTDKEQNEFEANTEDDTGLDTSTKEKIQDLDHLPQPKCDQRKINGLGQTHTTVDNDTITRTNNWYQVPNSASGVQSPDKTDNHIDENELVNEKNNQLTDKGNDTVQFALQSNLSDDTYGIGCAEHNFRMSILKEKFKAKKTQQVENSEYSNECQSASPDTRIVERNFASYTQGRDTEYRKSPRENIQDNMQVNICLSMADCQTVRNMNENQSKGEMGQQISNSHENDNHEENQSMSYPEKAEIVSAEENELNIKLVDNTIPNISGSFHEAQKTVENRKDRDQNVFSKEAKELEHDLTKSDAEHKGLVKSQQMEGFICCDTCNFKFTCKDGLKMHFIQNPKCFSKVCNTSKISEEFGWQLLDYYLASLEVKVPDEIENQKLNTSQNSHSSAFLSDSNNSAVPMYDKALCKTIDMPRLRQTSDTRITEKSKLDVIPADSHTTDKSAYMEKIHKKGYREESDDAVYSVTDKLVHERQSESGEWPDIDKGLVDISESIHQSSTGSTDKSDDKNNNETENNVNSENALNNITNMIDFPERLSQMQGKLESVEVHNTELNEKLKFKCQFCGEKLDDEDSLDLHLKNHSIDRPYECMICKRNFTHKHNLKRHMMSHNSKSVECYICGRGFKEQFYLQMHMKVHLEENSQSCEICGEVVAKSELSNHVNSHIGPIEENPTYAQIAERNQEILNENIGALDLTKNSRLSKETLMKMNVDQLKEFLMKGQNTANEMNYTNDENIPNIDSHSSINQKLLKAELNRFKENPDQSLQKSQSWLTKNTDSRKDSDINAKTCISCHLTFTSKRDLANHIETIHKQERSHICRTCGKGFKQSRILRQHEKIHLRDRLR